MLIAWATIFCNSCCRLSLNNCVIFILKTKQNKKKFENLTVLRALLCEEPDWKPVYPHFN